MTGWDQALAQMGWAGMLAGALCYVFHLYTAVQNKRIDGLEKRAEGCERDRAELHRRLEDLYTKD